MRRVKIEASRRCRVLAASIGIALAVGFAAVPVAQAQDPCAGQGNAVMSIVGDIVPAPGVTIQLQIAGRPNAPVSLILDFGPGPTVVQGVGTVCLDLGPRYRIVFDGIRTGSPRLGPDGIYTMSLPIPPRPQVSGRSFYAQAIIRDNTAPNGFAITNLVTLDMRETILERFNDTDNRDAAQTSALWGNGELRGIPKSGPRTRIHRPSQSQFLLSHPLVEVGNPLTTGARMQMIFQNFKVGAMPGESILGMEWSPKSNFTFASTYTNVKMILDHAKDTPPDGINKTFDLNYDDRDATEPQVVYQGDYTLQNGTGVEWVPWPTFDAPFEYDSGRPLLFEWDMPAGGDTYQLFKNESYFYIPFSRVFGDGGSERAVSTGENTTYWTRFTFFQDRAIGRSTWFRISEDPAPDYHTPYVIAVTPPGTSVHFEYEGGRDIVGNGEADPVSFSGFKADIDEIDGYEFIRFRVTLRPTDEGAVPFVKSVSIPYSLE